MRNQKNVSANLSIHSSAAVESKRVRIVDILQQEEEDHLHHDMNSNKMEEKQCCSATAKRARSWFPLSSIWPFSRCSGSLRQQSTCESKENMETIYREVSNTKLKQDCVDSMFPGGTWLGHEGLFNIGLVFGIAFMVNSSKNEIEKLRESVKHTERLVENLKQEASFRGRDLHLSTSCPRTECKRSSGILRHDSDRSSSSIITTESMSTSQHSGTLMGRAQLEAELEAELEILELNLTTCGCSPQKILSHNQIATSNIDRNFSSSGISRKNSSHEAEDIDQTKLHVSPVELEKRLHVLLQKRQQDCIEELEAGLKSTENKLVDKEKELSWLKEHVRQILQEKSESSTLSGDNSTAWVSRGEEMSRCLVMPKVHHGADLIQHPPSESAPLFLMRNQLDIGDESEFYVKDLISIYNPQNKGGNKRQMNGTQLQTVAYDKGNERKCASIYAQNILKTSIQEEEILV